MDYLYETHLHTSQASACATTRGKDYVQRYIDLGFTGIMVTDHFFNSNTTFDRRKHWREWVKGFCSGYEDARNEGEKRGLDVFFGWEETFDGDDYLIYGLDKTWLLEHPEMVRWTREEQFWEVHRYGGCVVHAHSFRQHAYLSTVTLSPYLVDAIEAANAGNHDAIYDAQAFEYARILGLPAVAGSDAHGISILGRNGGPYGISVTSKLSSVHDYVSLIMNKQYVSLHIPPGRCTFQKSDGDRPLTLKAEIRDSKDKTTGRLKMCFNDVANYLLKAG
ncbi:MAG: PHP domain-containing protein [Treponema sp.]|nr:PHP domain-containing protein [Treponema sp.]